VLRRGDSGAAVAEVRARLAHLGLITDAPTGDPADFAPSGSDPAVFDETLDRAVRSFQQERGITVDGIVGPHTYRRLEEARWQLGDRVLSYIPGHLMAGDDVTELQRRLNRLGFDAGRADGLFGVQTDAALREFQKGVGVTADGICGPDTFRAFDRLVRTISGGNADTLRDTVTLLDLQTGVADKVVVLDPGDTVDGPLCHAIATRVEGRLAALGTQVLLTRPAHPDPATATPDDPARAEFANQVGADLVLSLHVARCTSPLPNGLATFFYGDPRGGQHSPSGRVLANRVQDELSSRTDLLDCRTHPRTWDLLRLTRMPAVRIELGYLSHEGDARRLTNPDFHDAVAEGIAAAVTRFCAPR
jgi:N-acetylmuramoyl-L-alanine amidase